jgi:hypothetical protein
MAITVIVIEMNNATEIMMPSNGSMISNFLMFKLVV